MPHSISSEISQTDKEDVIKEDNLITSIEFTSKEELIVKQNLSKFSIYKESFKNTWVKLKLHSNLILFSYYLLSL